MGKIKVAREGWMTTKAERRWYGASVAGGNVYGGVMGFLTSYLLLQGIRPELIAGAMLAVKIWDGVNDFLFGAIVDAVKFKKGKFLPWLRIGLFAVPITFILMFSIPSGWDVSLKIIWYVIAYMLGDIASTINDVPSQGLLTTITNRQDERVHYLNNSKLIGTFAAFLIYIVGAYLTGENVGMSVSRFAISACIAAFLLSAPFIFIAKERVNIVTSQEKKYTFRQMFTYMGSNKYWLIYCLGTLVSTGLYFMGGLAQFMGFYLFGSSMIAIPVLIIATIPTVIIFFLLPKMLNKVDKMIWARWGNVAMGIIATILYFVGYQNLYIYFAILFFMMLASAPSRHMMFMFAPDCIEYGKYQTDIDGRGITYATQALVFKLGGAIASALSMLLLGLFGWVEVTGASFAELATSGIVQPQSAINGLWALGILFPGLGYLISGLIFFAYKLKDKDVQIMAKCNSGEITREEAEAQLSRSYSTL